MTDLTMTPLIAARMRHADALRRAHALWDAGERDAALAEARVAGEQVRLIVELEKAAA